MLLDQIRVLDLTDHRGEVGPWYLGLLGAEVIKVEPPGGSPARFEPPLADRAEPGLASLQFAAYNAGKRSIVLDLAGSAEDREAFLTLIAGADIVFDSGPPGAIAAGGIAEADLVAANPTLVSVLVTPFGADGPRADQPASELTLAALGGPMSLQGVRERAPIKVSIPQVWRHTGSEAAIAALVALRRMERSGEPQFVDVSAQAAMTWTMLNSMEAAEVQGFDFERAGSTVRLAVDIDLRRETVDGYSINAPVGVTTGPIMPWLVEEGIAPASWADQDWTTYDHRALSGEQLVPSYDDLREALDELCGRYTRNELLVMGVEYGATFAPVNTIPDLLTFEHLSARSFWAESAQVATPGHPLIIDGTRPDTPPGVVGPEVDSSGEPLRQEPPRSRRMPSTNTAPAGELPLEGVRVADFSWIGVGPITARSLADHGATVVRVETESRLDTLRAQAPFKDGEFGINRSNFYGSFNTSKWSMALDLTTDAGVAIAKRMTEWADVVIDSFRPGTMERLGLGAEAIHEVNPSAIAVTTSLLGGGGRLSSLAGYGFHAAAIAGFTELVGWPDLGPDGPWMAYTDTIGPRFLTSAILAALDRRERTGQGCAIEGAQLEIGLQYLAPEILDHQVTGRLPSRLGNREILIAPQGAYPCAGDDQWCAITVPDDGAWAALVDVLGRPEWASAPQLETTAGRLAAHDEIDASLSRWTASQEATDVEKRLAEVGIPAGKINRSADLAVDPQYIHRNFYRRLEHSEVGEVPYAGHQYRIRGYDSGPRFAAPMLGEHTYEVCTELLGMDPDDVAEAAAAGALE